MLRVIDTLRAHYDVVQYGCLEYHRHKYPLSLKATDRYRGSHELIDGPTNGVFRPRSPRAHALPHDKTSHIQSHSGHRIAPRPSPKMPFMSTDSVITVAP